MRALQEMMNELTKTNRPPFTSRCASTESASESTCELSSLLPVWPSTLSGVGSAATSGLSSSQLTALQRGMIYANNNPPIRLRIARVEQRLLGGERAKAGGDDRVEQLPIRAPLARLLLIRFARDSFDLRRRRVWIRVVRR